MDEQRFDEWTKTLLSRQGARRAALQLLAGGLLGGVVARVAGSDVAVGKTPRRRGRVQPEGNGKGKKHKKKDKKKEKDKKPDDQPPQCCADGPCSPLPCCPGQKPCGGGCVAQNLCCWHHERTCPDGACVPGGTCCKDEVQCADGSCVPWDTCCPGQKLCGGECIPESQCCPENECCPDAVPPLCQQCEQVVCNSGDWSCRPTSRVPCGEGCCPEDYFTTCHSPGYCRTPDPPPYQFTCASGYDACGVLLRCCPPGTKCCRFSGTDERCCPADTPCSPDTCR